MRFRRKFFFAGAFALGAILIGYIRELNNPAKSLMGMNPWPLLNGMESTIENIGDICVTQRFSARNKKLSGRYGLFGGHYMPLACIQQLEEKKQIPEECKLPEVDIDLEFAINRAPILGIDQRISQELFNRSLRLIMGSSKISMSTANLISISCDKLARLRDIIINSRLGKQLARGNCQQHASNTAVEILKYNLQAPQPVKIQYVYVSQRDDTENHGFILIDANWPDIQIYDNIAEVKKHFKKLTAGKICDTWNEGYYHPINTNTNSLYRSDASWASLVVQTISLDLNFEELPAPIRQLHQQELSEIIVLLTSEDLSLESVAPQILRPKEEISLSQTEGGDYKHAALRSQAKARWGNIRENNLEKMEEKVEVQVSFNDNVSQFSTGGEGEQPRHQLLSVEEDRRFLQTSSAAKRADSFLMSITQQFKQGLAWITKHWITKQKAESSKMLPSARASSTNAIFASVEKRDLTSYLNGKTHIFPQAVEDVSENQEEQIPAFHSTVAYRRENSSTLFRESPNTASLPVPAHPSIATPSPMT